MAIKLLCLCVCLLASGSHAMPVSLGGEAVLNGENQVPDTVATSMTATFNATLTEDGQIDWVLQIFDAVNVTMAHIHLGNATTNGPPVVFLVPVGEGDAADGTASLPMLATPQSGAELTYAGSFDAEEVGAPLTGDDTEELLAIIKAADTYVNVHTVEEPAGAIRGQIEWN